MGNDGSFLPATLKEEMDIRTTVGGNTYPVGDIDFNQRGDRVLLSEIQMNSAGTGTGSHGVHNMEWAKCTKGQWVEDKSNNQSNGTKYATGFLCEWP